MLENGFGRDKYGIFKLCAPSRASRLGHHLLCSQIYAEKIAAVAGENFSPEDSVYRLLERHRFALYQRPDYRNSFISSDGKNMTQWDGMEVYMATAVAEGEDLHPNRY
ncbi:hypothetical protein V7S43_011071 [Phytophthora oleae]|uniref:Uncharacterized protein n=1 Tax=Phytophthora oleae TaxID=2107226 RepID=A0ABD3FD70_9STRA